MRAESRGLATGQRDPRVGQHRAGPGGGVHPSADVTEDHRAKRRTEAKRLRYSRSRPPDAVSYALANFKCDCDLRVPGRWSSALEPPRIVWRTIWRRGAPCPRKNHRLRTTKSSPER